MGFQTDGQFSRLRRPGTGNLPKAQSQPQTDEYSQ